MKYLFYAIGGGLGHLSRVSAFIFTKKIPIDDCLILSSSEFSKLFFKKNKYIKVPQNLETDKLKLTNYIQEVINKNNFETIYIDTFPAGIIGELAALDLKSSKLILLARDINWKLYKSNFPLNKLNFKIIYKFEDFDKEYDIFLRTNSSQIINIKLEYPKKTVNSQILNRFRSEEKEVWLIVHSMPEDEVLAILDYAKDLASLNRNHAQFIVITQCLNADFKDALVLDYFPAYELFPYVDKIFTAAGFNLMQQTSPFAKKHICIPFPRKYDRQLLRSKRTK